MTAGSDTKFSFPTDLAGSTTVTDGQTKLRYI